MRQPDSGKALQRVEQLEAELAALRKRLGIIEQSEERFKQAIELSATAYCHHDRDLKYTWIHHPHMGFNPSDVIGKTDWEILEPELADRMGVYKRQVLETGKGVRVEIPTRLNDPKAEVFDMIIEPLRDQSGQVVGLSCAGNNITELKHAELTVQQRDMQLNEVQRVANLGYYVYDVPSDHWESSQILNHIFGIDSQYAKNAASWIALVSPEMRLKMSEYLVHLLEMEDTFDYEYPIIRQSDGACRWVHGLGSIERDADGRALRMFGTVHDITERKLSEAKLANLSRLYKFRSMIDQAIVRLPVPSELFALACRCAVEYGGMMMAFICRHDAENQSFVPLERYGTHVGYVDSITLSSDPNRPEGRGPIGTAFRENRYVYINDFRSNELTRPWHELGRPCGWESVAAFPILRNGSPYVVLSVYSERLNAFDTESLEELDALTKSISFAMDNYEREMQRKHSEESLHLAALVYRESSEAMVVTDPMGVVIDVNLSFTDLTGYAKDEVVGRNIRILQSGHHDRAFYKAMWDALNSSGKWQGEIWNRRKNGEIYPEWISISTAYAKDGSVLRRVALSTDITVQKESQEIIWHQANYDALTNLPNRRMFIDRLNQGIKSADRSGLQLAVMFIDLDNFKEVNDSLGHEQGDVLLQEVARRLTGAVRESDTVGRLGGDEFVVVLEDIDDCRRIDRIAESILDKIAAPYHLGPNLSYVSASIGITLYPVDAATTADLLKNADHAMYESKRLGRNRFNYFKAAMQEMALRRVGIAVELREAIQDGQFRLYYQPIVNLKTFEIDKAEALIRWLHPSRGLVSPVEFISIAEETGLIIPIGEWVFREAANQAAKWHSAQLSVIQISVNKSPIQFRDRKTPEMTWGDYLATLGLKGNSITVEITESMLMDASDEINSKLMEFRDAGIQVSLDDFGTGYSSLAYLKKFDIDFLKIDQSFVRGLNAESSDRALCEAIIVMAHKLGMKVIAEGIETEDQRDILMEAGCDYGQGYLFSRPLPTEEFEKLLRTTFLP